MGKQSRATVVVAGPTASGKSGLALALAEAFDGVVINADSMQVYRDLQVLTARPGPAETARVPHRLYGIMPASQACSAALWRDLAAAEIEAAQRAGRLPIVVGGTGLYLRALIEGLAPVPEVPPAARAEAAALHRTLGGERFHAALATRDPATAARLRPGDTQRLIRAYEVAIATGRPLAEWQSRMSEGALAGPVASVLLQPPREELYARCDLRLALMLRAGALEEVRRLLSQGLPPGLPAMKALGIADLARHLAGEITLQEALASAQQATRRYAKRQTTWFRHQFAADVVTQLSESTLPKIFAFIRQFLLTRGTWSV